MLVLAILAFVARRGPLVFGFLGQAGVWYGAGAHPWMTAPAATT